MTYRIASIIILIAALFSSGCKTSSETIWTSELAAQEGRGPVRVLTVDSTVITLNDFTFDDSFLIGTGNMRKDGNQSGFDGSIPFSRIIFIERLRTNTAKAIWIIPVAAMTALAMIELASHNGFTINPHQPNGSCPTVYAFDGENYHLEAEAFATSISKAMEATSFSLLSRLREHDGQLRVRVANERPETHMINAVRLFAADAGQANSVVLDIENRLWPINCPEAPRSAVDGSGRDASKSLAAIDDKLWISDLSNITAGSGFRDSLELEFDLPKRAKEATLIIRAINTDLITEVYRSVGGLLGDATMQFYQSLESDPVLQKRIRSWLEDCSLTIDINGKDGWTTECSMHPEANMAAYSRALRIRVPENSQGPLRVRLSTLTDVWRIDAVLIDCSPAEALPLQSLPLLSVESSSDAAWGGAVAENDSDYAILLPPDEIVCEFDAGKTAEMRKPVYVFSANGYLYEWFPNDQDSPGAKLAANLSDQQRIDMLTMLIGQKDIFLPPIYAQWRKSVSALQQ